MYLYREHDFMKSLLELESIFTKSFWKQKYTGNSIIKVKIETKTHRKFIGDKNIYKKKELHI